MADDNPPGLECIVECIEQVSSVSEGLGPVGRACCSCCLSTITLLMVVLPLFVNPHNPAFSVEEFYVPAFNKTANNATSNTISFNIKLQNQNKKVGLYYDHSVNLTISYTYKQTNDKFIWQYSVPKFYQGDAQSRRLVDEIQMLGGNVQVWNQIAVAENAWIPPSRAMMTLLEPLQIFKVDIITKVRFRLIGKHHGKELVVSALVPIVPNTGEMFTKEGIKTSVASGIGWSGTQVAVLVVSTAISTIFI